MEVLGTDYPTPDGTCIRDYIHVSDLVRAHTEALAYLRAGGASMTLNCGYGRGFSVLEVIDAVKRVSGVDFRVELAGRRAGDPAHIVAACEPHSFDSQLAAELRRSADHRRARAGMGAQACNARCLRLSHGSHNSLGIVSAQPQLNVRFRGDCVAKVAAEKL